MKLQIYLVNVLVAISILAAIGSLAAIGAAWIELKPAAVRLQVTLSKLDGALDDVHNIELETQRTEAEMAGLLNQSRHAMLTEAQQKALVASTQRVLADSDTSVVKLGSAIDSLSQIAPAVTLSVDQMGADAHGLLGASTEAVNAARDDFTSPELKDALIQVDASAKNTAAVTGEAAGTMKKVHEGVDYEVALLEKPASKVKLIILTMASALGNFVHGLL